MPIAIMMTSHMRTSVTRRDLADTAKLSAGHGHLERIPPRRWIPLQVPPEPWDFEVEQGKTL